MNNFNFIYNKVPKEIYFPNSKNENWRYINLNLLKEKIKVKLTKLKVKNHDTILFNLNFIYLLNI